jgi:hypothetical protein
LKEDEQIYEDFRKLLDPIAKEKKIEIVTAEEPLPKCPIEKVFPLIDQSDFCLILASKREFKNDKGEHTTSFWVYGEMTYALTRHKPTMIFKEDCVQLGSLPEFFTEFIPFNRERIIAIAPKLRQYIEACLKKLERDLQHQDAYTMEEFISRDTIFINGFGIATAKVKVKISSLINEILQIRHSYDLGKCARKNILLDNLANLYNKKNVSERFEKQTFLFESDEENTGISFGRYKKRESQEFFIKIPLELQKKMIEENKCLIYEWGISCPHMYPTLKSEIERLRSTIEDDIYSSLIVIHNIKKAVFSVDFEKGYKFSKIPCFEVYDGSGNLKKENIPRLIHKKRLYYDRYEAEIFDCIRSERYVIKWVPA